MHSFTLRNAHFFVGLFVLTMVMTLILEQFWGKLIGIFVGMILYFYLAAKKWIKGFVESVTEYFTKVYDILSCIRFVQQDGVVETVKINAEIKMLKKSLMELMRSNKQCAKSKSNRSFVNNPGFSRNQKSNNVRVKTAARGVQSNIGPACNKPKVFDVCDSNSGYSNIQTWDISALTPDHMMRYFKICMERSCCKVMLSDQPIRTNLCKHCKPARGKSIDFYQFLTSASGRIQYFCGCIKCRTGNTASCLETYCYLCTFPKTAKRTTT